jgi:hypothetical protein
MARIRLAGILLVVASSVCSACGSSSSPGSAPTQNGEGGSCPDISGTWTVTAHCDTSLIGQKAVVTESACALSFAAPFNGFTGSVSAGGGITLGGPQSCTGTVSSSSITMTCTPGTCSVALSR